MMQMRIKAGAQYRHSASRMSLVALVIISFLLVGAAARQAQTWDLQRDFSVDENPSGPWSFGWQDSLTEPFTPYDLLWGKQDDVAIKGFFAPGWFGPVRAWCKTRSDAAHMIDALPPPGELYYPDHWVEADFQGKEVVRQAAGLPSYPDPTGYVGKNLTADPFGSWGYYWEPEMVLMMPPGKRGPTARTVVRWTSPVAARVAVAAEFTGQRIQGDAGTRAEVHVRHNGVKEFAGKIDGFIGQRALHRDDAMGPTPNQAWSKVLSVAAGDTIEFAVGAGEKFNFGVFGVQNKQLLPGVGLAARISVVPDDKTLAQNWVAARFGGDHAPAASPADARAPDGIVDYGADSGTPPFSFNYDGHRFADEWQSWKATRSTRSLDAHRTEHVLEFTEPHTGLVARCVGVAYNDFPTVEWTLYLKNSGTADSPLLEDVQALDLSIKRLGIGEFSLQRIEGAQLLDTRLAPNARRRLVDPFPYFNIGMPGGGLIVAVSWSGQAAVEFNRDDSDGLQLRAGQALTRFKLHPGEEIRTPMIALQFWSGDRVDSQNVWRRWMIAHNMPQPGGEPLGPQRAASSAYQFGNMVKATEENQKQFIDRYVEEQLKPDFWWMDAGWYPPNRVTNGTQLWGPTGTWEPDRRRFPHGLRAIADYAHARDIGVILWCQPERASPGTDLYTQHPEFLLGADGADKLLDFGNPAAWKWAADHFSRLIADEGIDIYRQDMNIGPVGFWRAHDAPDRQGITENKHVTGYLAYLDELVRSNPHVRLDHFRVDLETLRRAAPLILGVDFDPAADQCHNYRVATWIPWHGLCSRVIDPYWFRSMMCPAIVTGWDVRRTDLDYDLARRLVSEWEQIAPYYLGDFYPLTPYSFDDGIWMAWQFDRPEVGQGVVQAFRRRDSPQESATYRLRGLDPEASYTVTDFDTGRAQTISGRELIEEGLVVRVADKPGSALIKYQRAK